MTHSSPTRRSSYLPQQERIARFANPPQHRSFRFDADHKRNRQKDRIAVEWDRLQTVLRIKLGRSLAMGHEPVSDRSEEHTSELQSLMRISFALFCLKNKKKLAIMMKINSTS